MRTLFVLFVLVGSMNGYSQFRSDVSTHQLIEGSKAHWSIGEAQNLVSQEKEVTPERGNRSQPPSALAMALVENGFYNVAVKEENGDLIIAYENLIHRFEVAAIEEVLHIIRPYVSDQVRNLILFVQSLGIPVLVITVPVDANFKSGTQPIGHYLKDAIVSNETESYWKEVKDIRPENSSYFKPVLVLDPMIGFGLGGFPDPIKHQVSIAPTLRLSPRQGMMVILQGVIPLANELDIPEEKLMRPGLLTVNQHFKLPHNTFALISVGYFSNYNYGAVLGVNKLLFQGNFLAKAQVGYTGYASYPIRLYREEPKRGWQYSRPYYLNYHAGLGYRFAQWDLTLDVSAGRFLYFEDAIRMEVNRQYGETDIGFFAFFLKGGSNYGIQVSIPLVPRKYWRANRMILRPPKNFSWRYHTTQTYLGQFETGSDLNSFLKKLNPAFISNQLSPTP